MNAIESIMEQLRELFPEAQVNLNDEELLIRFTSTHISTEKISKIEEILFFKGKLVSNSKKLINVENGTLHVNLKNWGVFYRAYLYLQSIGIIASIAEINIIGGCEIAFVISNYLCASQLDNLQNIVNEELGIHLVNHDSIRVFGGRSVRNMYINCAKR